MVSPRRPIDWRYSRWDGTQSPIEVVGDDVLRSLSDDLLYHGDLEAALRRLLREGFENRAGERIAGLQELMERLREQRSEIQRRLDPDGFTEKIARELEEILSMERSALDESVRRAMSSNDDAAIAEARTDAAQHHSELDFLPTDPAGQISGLSQYSFHSEAAKERFEELLAGIRHDLTQLQLDQAAGALAGAGPEEREHLRAGLDALNKMIEQQGAGEPIDPSFEQFMENFGDLFPGNAQNLDELLAQIAQRMAQASALMASMTDAQRAQLEAMSAELLQDLDLAWQMDRLGANLRDALPRLNWDASTPLAGGLPTSLDAASSAVGELAELARLEQMLQQASDPGALAEIDFDAVEAQLGKESAESLRRLSELTRMLEDQGLVDRRDGRLQMTPKGLRRLGQQALSELFSRLKRDRFGNHALAEAGLGQDRDIETKPYEFGDPFNLHIEQTMRNALLREAAATERLEVPIPFDRLDNDGHARIQLTPDDFSIERTEHLSSASTVLAIDLSLSMPMRDNFLAAKKVAIALQSLIASQYPRDYLGLVGFSATAREIRPQDLPEMSWDFAYGTNLEHALSLSRRLLAGRSGSKQVIVITDGEPTAHVMANGEVFFNYPPVPETLAATFAEVVRCTRERIVINAFVLDATGSLRAFIEQMTQRNRGRAFFTTPSTLGDYVLVDFVEHRSKKRVRKGA